MFKGKKITAIVLVLCLCLSTIGCGGASTAESSSESNVSAVTAENPIRLTMQSMIPNTVANYKLYEKFCENVKNASNGRLIIDLQVVGAIAEFNDTFNAVRDGALDLAAFASSAGVGLMGNIAYTFGAAGAPGGLQPDEMIGWTYAGGGEELMRDIFNEHGVTYITMSSMGMAEIFCHSHKKLETLDDFKGLKFRTMGMWGDMLKSVGASVVNISVNDLYSSAEKQIIDAFEYLGPMPNYQNGYHEICKYIGVPGVHSPSNTEFLICNNDVYKSIPEDLRVILYECSKAIALESLYVNSLEDAKGLELLEQTGAEIFHLSDEAQQEFVNLAADFHRKWMEEDPRYKEVFMSQKEYVDSFKLQESSMQTSFSVYDAF